VSEIPQVSQLDINLQEIDDNTAGAYCGAAHASNPYKNVRHAWPLSGKVSSFVFQRAAEGPRILHSIMPKVGEPFCCFCV